MIVSPGKLIAVLAIVVSLASGVALAGLRSPGETMTWDLTELRHDTVQSTQAPSGVSAEHAEAFRHALALAAQTAGKPAKYVFKVQIDRVDADGNAHLNASMENQSGADGPLGPAGAAAMARIRAMRSNFPATLTPEGQIVPIADLSMQPQVGYAGRPVFGSAYTQNLAAQENIDRLAQLNAFALGCGQRTNLTAGQSWKSPIQAQYGPPAIYSFLVTGSGTIGGHNVVAVTMTGGYEDGANSRQVAATGHYDPSERLVIDLHGEVRSVYATGPSTVTQDFSLR